jgi:subtilisin family serine protease
VSTDELFQATEYARINGVIIVAAAGTGTGSFTVYPASYRSVIGVTSVDEGCRADDQTAYSPFIDVAGPGKNAWLPLSLKHPRNNNESYAVRPAFGTSLSTPHVAGIASLWIAHHGRGNLERRFGRENISWLFKFILQNRQKNQKGAVHDCDGRFQRDNPGMGNQLGSGVIDAHALLSLDLNNITRSMIEAYASNKDPSGIRPPGAGLGTQLQLHSQEVARAIGDQIRAFIQRP